MLSSAGFSSFVIRRALHDGRILAHQLGADELVDFRGSLRVFLEEFAGILAALADALVAVGEPRAGLMDDIQRHGIIQQAAFLADALAVENVELPPCGRAAQPCS